MGRWIVTMMLGGASVSVGCGSQDAGANSAAEQDREGGSDHRTQDRLSRCEAEARRLKAQTDRGQGPTDPAFPEYAQKEAECRMIKAETMAPS